MCVCVCVCVSIVLKSGSLKLLEPSGPVQACNGIALLLYIFIYMCIYIYIYTHISCISYVVWKLSSQDLCIFVFKSGTWKHLIGSLFGVAVVLFGCTVCTVCTVCAVAKWCGLLVLTAECGLFMAVWCIVFGENPSAQNNWEVKKLILFYHKTCLSGLRVDGLWNE